LRQTIYRVSALCEIQIHYAGETTEEKKKTYKFSNFKPKGRRPFGKPFVRWEINKTTETLDLLKFLD
jgi:hypothetical protein